MSDLLRMTGMYSGMDTEAIIQQMLQAKALAQRRSRIGQIAAGLVWTIALQRISFFNRPLCVPDLKEKRGFIVFIFCG